jgi:glycosyltransferase involved in cell wall biosynthesis
LGEKLNQIKFLIIGPDDGYLNEVRNLIKKMNLNENVKILGYLEKSNGELYNAYASSNILIVPSKYENFGHIFVEAGVLKIPIVTSALYTDVFEKDDVYFFKYGDINTLANKIKHVMNNPAEAQEKAENYHEKIIKMDTWKDMANKYEKIYKKLLKLE